MASFLGLVVLLFGLVTATYQQGILSKLKIVKGGKPHIATDVKLRGSLSLVNDVTKWRGWREMPAVFKQTKQLTQPEGNLGQALTREVVSKHEDPLPSNTNSRNSLLVSSDSGDGPSSAFGCKVQTSSCVMDRLMKGIPNKILDSRPRKESGNDGTNNGKFRVEPKVSGHGKEKGPGSGVVNDLALVKGSDHNGEGMPGNDFGFLAGNGFDGVYEEDFGYGSGSGSGFGFGYY